MTDLEKLNKIAQECWIIIANNGWGQRKAVVLATIIMQIVEAE